MIWFRYKMEKTVVVIDLRSTNKIKVRNWSCGIWKTCRFWCDGELVLRLVLGSWRIRTKIHGRNEVLYSTLMEAYHLTPIVKDHWWLLILTSNGPTSLIRFTCLQWLQCVPAQVRSQWPFPGSRPKIERPRKTGCTAWNFNHIVHTHQIVSSSDVLWET